MPTTPTTTNDAATVDHAQRTPDGDERIRARELPIRLPVLSRSAWNAALATGAVPSRKLGRARIVKLSDAIAYLDGTLADGGAR